ncbi:MAG: hypothetical protein AAF711_03230, partial [Planctomycetota bacterium]
MHDFLLYVRREMQQVHDLRHAGLGDVGEASQFGHVADLASAEEVVEADRQGHELGDPGDA